LEVALGPWIFVLAVIRFSGFHFLAFLLYVLLISLYGEIVLPKHRALYHKTADALVSVVPVLQEKGQEPVNQVLQVGEAIYPRGLIEKIKE
jgi:hypothetical protein